MKDVQDSPPPALSAFFYAAGALVRFFSARPCPVCGGPKRESGGLTIYCSKACRRDRHLLSRSARAEGFRGAMDSEDALLKAQRQKNAKKMAQEAVRGTL